MKFATGLFLAVSVLSLPYSAMAGAGDLDPSFGSGGKVLTAFSSGSFADVATAVAIQADGKIIAAGSSGDPAGLRHFALSRYNTDGTLDTSFGGTGKVITVFAQDDLINGLAIQPDGKIVAVGASFSGGYHYALARYNTDGSLDTTFGGGTGKVVTGFGGDGDYGQAAVIQSDGKIVVVGTTNAGPRHWGLARYNSDGSLDGTFGSGGRVHTFFGGSADAATGVAIQTDGKIVAAGGSNSGGNYRFALARYNPADGSLDSTFGSGGEVLTSFGGTDDQSYHALAIQTDGKIVAAGWSNQPGGMNYDFAMARYNRADGSLDSTFGSGGKVLTAFGSSGGDTEAHAIAIQTDGKLVLAGSSTASDPNNNFALARYNTDGSLDSTFGSGGKVQTDFSGSGSIDDSLAVAIQSDGKIVAAGYSNADGGHVDFALARYGAAGCPPPVITSLTATPNVLWPVNHKYVSVTLNATAQSCGPVTYQIVNVTSNEPVDADGDWVITGPLSLNLRAERLGTGTGRIYTITLQATDGSAQTGQKTTTVTVPHDQGH